MSYQSSAAAMYDYLITTNLRDLEFCTAEMVEMSFCSPMRSVLFENLALKKFTVTKVSDATRT